jgi:hypothetical protein
MQESVKHAYRKISRETMFYHHHANLYLQLHLKMKN